MNHQHRAILLYLQFLYRLPHFIRLFQCRISLNRADFIRSAAKYGSCKTGLRETLHPAGKTFYCPVHGAFFCICRRCKEINIPKLIVGITLRCDRRQARQPLQKPIVLSYRHIFSVLCPASSAPRMNASASVSEFPPFLGLVEITKIFLFISSAPSKY